MDSLYMDRTRGTKWFTFYTKVRPWFTCITAFTVIADFLQYVDVYTSYWWMMVHFLGAIAQAVLAIMVFTKSRGDYRDFVRFVKGVLLFETFYIAYGQGVQQYIQNDFDIGVTLVVVAILLVLAYFIWYSLNIKYFRKRLIVSEFAADTDFVKPNFTTNQIPESAKTVFCRKCGTKLLDGARFCDKCGTEVIERSE